MVLINCEENKTPIISWNYPSEETQERNANEYVLNGAYAIKTFFFGLTTDSLGRYTDIYKISYFVFDFTGNVIAFSPEKYSWYIAAECKNVEYYEEEAKARGRTPPTRSSIQIKLDEQHPGYCILGSEVRSAEPNVYASIPELRRDYGYRRLGVEVTFEVKNQGVLIYTRTDRSIPNISTYCQGNQQCPENTCEVICGDTICCYNSEGISVESFPAN